LESHIFDSIVVLLKNMFFIKIKYHLKNKIWFKLKLRWMIIVPVPLLLFNGCSDIETDMRDTRTVTLNMDFHGKSPSRNRFSVSESELSEYKLTL